MWKYLWAVCQAWGLIWGAYQVVWGDGYLAIILRCLAALIFCIMSFTVFRNAIENNIHQKENK